MGAQTASTHHIVINATPIKSLFLETLAQDYNANPPSGDRLIITYESGNDDQRTRVDIAQSGYQPGSKTQGALTWIAKGQSYALETCKPAPGDTPEVTITALNCETRPLTSSKLFPRDLQAVLCSTRSQLQGKSNIQTSASAFNAICQGIESRALTTQQLKLKKIFLQTVFPPQEAIISIRPTGLQSSTPFLEAMGQQYGISGLDGDSLDITYSLATATLEQSAGLAVSQSEVSDPATQESKPDTFQGSIIITQDGPTYQQRTCKPRSASEDQSCKDKSLKGAAQALPQDLRTVLCASRDSLEKQPFVITSSGFYDSICAGLEITLTSSQRTLQQALLKSACGPESKCQTKK